MSITEETNVPVENDELLKRVEGLEAAQATQTAAMAGAEATQAAVNAGMASTAAAMQAGNMATMVVGSVSLIVGIFLGLTIHKSR
jgi:hypothetical protein